jgi:hypothetical protein
VCHHFEGEGISADGVWSRLMLFIGAPSISV